MSKIELTGGAGEYKISDVLGQKFQQFVTILEGSNNFEEFTFKQQDPELVTNRPNSPNDNDIHYTFSEFLIAASAAFREIEKPNIEKASIAGAYANIIYDMYDDLISGNITRSGIQIAPVEQFGFDQLPYKETNNLKYLVPGFHLLAYGHECYGMSGVYGRSNALQNVIRYLYHFIALLDVSNLNPKNVIGLLKGDYLYFMKYVFEIANIFGGTTYFATIPNFPQNSEGIITEGILLGLTAIAGQIINEYDLLNITPSLPGINIVNIDMPNVLDFATIAAGGATIKAYIKQFGFGGAKTDAIYTALVALKPYGAGVAAVVAEPDPARLKQYGIDSLLNPAYIFSVGKLEQTIDQSRLPTLLLGGNPHKKINESRNNDKKMKSRTKNHHNYKLSGGAKTGPQFVRPVVVVGTGVTKSPSLPFLYGPVDAAGTMHLAVDPVQGNQAVNANFVTLVMVNLVSDPRIGVPSGLAQLIQLGLDGPNENVNRIPLLALIDYMIVNKKNLDALNPEKVSLADHMKKALTGYSILGRRLNQIPKNTEFADFRDAFVSEFTLGTFKYFNVNTPNQLNLHGVAPSGMVGLLSTSNITKHNLTIPEIKDFYKNYVVKDSFYSTYFNLVQLVTAGTTITETDVDLNAAENASDADLASYRLNVKKTLGYARLTSGQRGGAGSYGDIVFLSRIPDYPVSGKTIGDLWLSKTIRVDRQTLLKKGAEAIRYIVRAIYNTNVGTNIVNIYGNNIDLLVVAQLVESFEFSSYHPDYFKRILQNIGLESIPGNQPIWKESELMFSEHMLREASKWEREGNQFVRRDQNGDIERIEDVDSCAFLDLTTRECFSFFSQCLTSISTDFPAACARMLDFDIQFEVNPSMNLLKELVIKIDPVIAFSILKQFRFGEYRDEEEEDPIRGFRRYKIQSVGSWLEELITGSDRCAGSAAPAQNPCNTAPLRDQLGASVADKIIAMAKDKTKYPFFNYLDMLVHWVNANQQALNKEEFKYPQTPITNYPKINKSFGTYDYLNPYRNPQFRLRGISCGLERLKSSIMNDLAGSNGPATISTIASMPLGISMPLGRPGFVSPVPIANSISMYGGEVYMIPK